MKMFMEFMFKGHMYVSGWNITNGKKCALLVLALIAYTA